VLLAVHPPQVPDTGVEIGQVRAGLETLPGVVVEALRGGCGAGSDGGVERRGGTCLDALPGQFGVHGPVAETPIVRRDAASVGDGVRIDGA
jgi:hypothetical protein